MNELNSILPHDLRAARSKSEAKFRAAVQDVLTTINKLAGQDFVQLVPKAPEVDQVLQPNELQQLESFAPKVWLTAKSAWTFCRPAETPTHGDLIKLGRQLSARYPLQTKRGPTRYYRITKPVSDAQETPGAEAPIRPPA